MLLPNLPNTTYTDGSSNECVNHQTLHDKFNVFWWQPAKLSEIWSDCSRSDFNHPVSNESGIKVIEWLSLSFFEEVGDYQLAVNWKYVCFVFKNNIFLSRHSEVSDNPGLLTKIKAHYQPGIAQVWIRWPDYTNCIFLFHFLGAVHKLCQSKIGGSRPPLRPLSANVSISPTSPPPFVSQCQFCYISNGLNCLCLGFCDLKLISFGSEGSHRPTHTQTHR